MEWYPHPDSHRDHSLRRAVHYLLCYGDENGQEGGDRTLYQSFTGSCVS